MNGKTKRITGLIAAIVLLAAFLIFVIVTNIRREKKERLISEKIESRKKAILEPEAELPQIEDFEGKEYLAEGPLRKEKRPELKEEKPPRKLKSLKDLSLEALSPEEKKQFEEEVLQREDQTLKIRPSPKEIEKLKKKGLIIY